MAVIFLGAGPKADPDDDKARRTHALCNEWWQRLADPQFTAALPKGAKERIKADVDKVWFNLAIYRGELSKTQRRQGAMTPVAVAHTSTMQGGGNPAAAAVQALAILAAAAIAVLVVTLTKAAFNAGQTLESSLATLQATSQQTAVIMTPVPLNFSPNINPAVLNDLITRGVIAITGGLMAISISKLRDFIDQIQNEIKEALARNICLAEVAALQIVMNALQALADEFEQMLKDGITAAVRDAMTKAIVDMLPKAFAALEALSACLAGGALTPSAPKPQGGKAN